MAKGGVAEQRVDGRQPGVAGRDGIGAFTFEVVQERRDQLGVDVGDVERRGLLAGAVAGEAEQQPPRVAVRGDGLGAGLAFRINRSVKNACNVGPRAL
jgi:hypothetical protein